MIIKNGVQIAGLKPIMQSAIDSANAVINEYNGTFMITSAIRTEEYNKLIGGHPKSKHLYGEAIDISVKLLQRGTRLFVVQELRKQLEPIGFDIVNEGNHIHIEYDPKTIKSDHLTSEDA
jgi:uncharacterized protein YcbK (DUF882 family)